MRKRLQVLVVDEHPIFRRGLKEVLTAEFSDLVVGEAENSQTALEMLVKDDWNLMLLAIKIPGQDGLEVLREAKHLRPDTAVLMVSGNSEEQSAIQSLKLGASGYLNKKETSEELLTAVRQILAGRKYVSSSLAERLASMIGGTIHQAAHEGLSNRELQVLKMIAVGRTIKQIASELSLSEKTIGTFKIRISKKLGLGTNVELARYALQHQLVE